MKSSNYLFLFIKVFFISLLTVSCIPIPIPLGIYLQPTYPSKSVKYIGESCHGSSGVMTGIEFEAGHGVVVQIRTPEVSNSEIIRPLYITYTISPKTSVNILSDYYTFIDNKNKKRKVIWNNMNISSYYGIKSDQTFSIQKILPNLSKKIKENSDDILYWFHFIWETDKLFTHNPNDVNLTLPKIETKNTTIRFSPIPMRLYFDNYVTENIYENQKSRYEECKKNNNSNSCENLLRYFGKSFDVIENNVTARGRVKIWDEKIRVFVDNINMNFFDDWKFENPEISLKDSKNDYIVNSKFSSITLNLKILKNPFTPIINTPNDVLYGSTTIEFSTSLEKYDVDGLIIKIPSMIINGEKVDFDNIIIEKKHFDWEFLPFNC